eukprot:tig00021070_g17811.t1
MASIALWFAMAPAPAPAPAREAQARDQARRPSRGESEAGGDREEGGAAAASEREQFAELAESLASHADALVAEGRRVVPSLLLPDPRHQAAAGALVRNASAAEKRAIEHLFGRGVPRFAQRLRRRRVQRPASAAEPAGGAGRPFRRDSVPGTDPDPEEGVPRLHSGSPEDPERSPASTLVVHAETRGVAIGTPSSGAGQTTIAPSPLPVGTPSWGAGRDSPFMRAASGAPSLAPPTPSVGAPPSSSGDPYPLLHAEPPVPQEGLSSLATAGVPPEGGTPSVEAAILDRVMLGAYAAATGSVPPLAALLRQPLPPPVPTLDPVPPRRASLGYAQAGGTPPRALPPLAPASPLRPAPPSGLPPINPRPRALPPLAPLSPPLQGQAYPQAVASPSLAAVAAPPLEPSLLPQPPEPSSSLPAPL